MNNTISYVAYCIRCGRYGGVLVSSNPIKEGRRFGSYCYCCFVFATRPANKKMPCMTDNCKKCMYYSGVIAITIGSYIVFVLQVIGLIYILIDAHIPLPGEIALMKCSNINDTACFELWKKWNYVNIAFLGEVIIATISLTIYSYCVQYKKKVNGCEFILKIFMIFCQNSLKINTSLFAMILALLAVNVNTAFVAIASVAGLVQPFIVVFNDIIDDRVKEEFK